MFYEVLYLHKNVGSIFFLYYADMRTKTTLELERPLYRQLKALAASEGKTLKKIMDEIIVLGLKARDSAPLSNSFSWPEGKNLSPLVAITDKEEVQNILDAGE